jgi:hypothetical protein
MFPALRSLLLACEQHVRFQQEGAEARSVPGTKDMIGTGCCAHDSGWPVGEGHIFN